MDDLSVLKDRAGAAVLSRDFVLAEKTYKKLLSYDKDNCSYLKELGNLYIKWGKEEQALDVWKDISEKTGENAECLITLGGIYRRLGKYDEAISVLLQAKQLSSENVQIAYNLGFTYRNMGMYEEAVKCFNEVIDKSPDDVLAYNHVGVIYATRGLHDLAIESYEKGLKVDPNHPILNLNIAKSYVAEGEYEKAVASYKNCLRFKPGMGEAVDDYVALLLKLNNSSEACDVVKKAIDINPTDIDLYVAKGNIFMYQEQFDNAEKEFRNALKIDDGSVKALKAFASAEEKLGKFDQAVEAVIKLEDKKTDDISILKFAVKILLSANRMRKVHEYLCRLWNINSKDCDTLSLLGQYYMCEGKLDKAVECYKRISVIDPDYKQGYDEFYQRSIEKNKIADVRSYLNSMLDEGRDTYIAGDLLTIFDRNDLEVSAANTASESSLEIDPGKEFESMLLEDIGIDLSPIDINDEDEVITEASNQETDNESVPHESDLTDYSNDIESIVDLSLLKDEENQDDDIVFANSESFDMFNLNESDLNNILDDQLPFDVIDGNDEKSILDDPIFDLSDDTDKSHDESIEMLNRQLDEALAEATSKKTFTPDENIYDFSDNNQVLQGDLEVVKKLIEVIPSVAKGLSSHSTLEKVKLYTSSFIKLDVLLEFASDEVHDQYRKSVVWSLIKYILSRMAVKSGLLANAEAIKKAERFYSGQAVNSNNDDAIDVLSSLENQLFALKDDSLAYMSKEQIDYVKALLQ